MLFPAQRRLLWACRLLTVARDVSHICAASATTGRLFAGSLLVTRCCANPHRLLEPLRGAARKYLAGLHRYEFVHCTPHEARQTFVSAEAACMNRRCRLCSLRPALASQPISCLCVLLLPRSCTQKVFCHYGRAMLSLYCIACRTRQ